MKSRSIVGTVAALATAGALIAINARDHAQRPPTDTADAVAMAAIFVGAVIWLVLRWTDAREPLPQLLRAVVVGVVVGGVVTAMASVVYDPWAN